MSKCAAKVNQKRVEIVERKAGGDFELGLGCRFVDAEESSARVSALELRGGDPWRIGCDEDVNKLVSEEVWKGKEIEGV